MEFRVLGPLEVVGPAGVVPVPGPRLRTILAVLLLHANEPVSAERLAEALFGEEATPNAVANVRVHVSRLRRALGDEGELIRTAQGGYELHLLSGQLDSERFGVLVEQARAAAPRDAAALLTQALALWRGRPLADLEFVAFMQPAIARLEEQRLAAIELRIEAELALGHAEAVVPELQDLVQRHPLRERAHAQLMLALYRTGRQAEALDVYRRLRLTFAEELAIEPSTELRELEAAILRQDASLEPARERRSVVRTPSRRVLALMALGTVAGVVTGMLALGGGDEPNRGEAAALGSPSAFPSQVVEVCEFMNTSFAEAKQEAVTLRRRLRTAKTAIRQRDAILEATKASADRGGYNLANLRSIETPAANRAVMNRTTHLWGSNLAEVRAYMLRLDEASTRGDLLRAIAPYTKARPVLEANFVEIKAGLQRMGGRSCRIDLYVAKPIPLPALPTPTPKAPRPTPSPKRPDVRPGTSTGTSGGGGSAPNVGGGSGGGSTGSGGSAPNVSGGGGGGGGVSGGGEG